MFTRQQQSNSTLVSSRRLMFVASTSWQPFFHQAHLRARLLHASRARAFYQLYKRKQTFLTPPGRLNKNFSAVWNQRRLLVIFIQLLFTPDRLEHFSFHLESNCNSRRLFALWKRTENWRAARAPEVFPFLSQLFFLVRATVLDRPITIALCMRSHTRMENQD